MWSSQLYIYTGKARYYIVNFDRRATSPCLVSHISNLHHTMRDMSLLHTPQSAWKFPQPDCMHYEIINCNSCYVRVLIFLCAHNTSPLLPPLLTPDGNVFEFNNFVSHSASPHSLLIITQLQCMYIGFLRPLRLDSKIIQHSGSLSMALHQLFPITMAKVCVLDFQHSR